MFYFICNHCISDIRALWRSALVARVPKCQKYGGYMWKQTLNLFQNYFSRWNYCKIISATLNMLENIH